MAEQTPGAEGTEPRTSGRSYQFDVTYGDSFLREASLRFAWARFGKIWLQGLIMTVVAAAALYFLWGDGGMLMMVLAVFAAALGLLILAFPVLIWRSLRGITRSHMELTGGGSVRFEADEEVLRTTYATGSSEMRWASFQETVRTKNALLLVMRTEDDRFIPLPVDQASEDALIFIEAEIAAHGGEAINVAGPPDPGEQ